MYMYMYTREMYQLNVHECKLLSKFKIVLKEMTFKTTIQKKNLLAKCRVFTISIVTYAEEGFNGSLHYSKLASLYKGHVLAP